DGPRISLETLHDKVIVLAGLNEWTVLPHAAALDFHQLLVSRLVELCLLLFHEVESLAALLHGELDERIARAGCRGRAIGENRGIGQRRVDVAPLLVRVWSELAVHRDLGCKGQIDLSFGQIHRLSFAGLRDGYSVVPNQLLCDIGNAILLALGPLGLLHRPRGTGNVWVLL